MDLLRHSAVAASPPPELTIPVVLLALITHQIFRRYETYSLAVHSALILVPPALPPLALAFNAQTIESLPSTLLLSYVIHLPTLILSVVLYRLSRAHPLARYPGPLICKITQFWIAFLSLKGHQHHYIKKLHEKYGDVVRVGPNALSIRDPELIKHLLQGISGVPKGPHQIGRLLTDKDPPMVAQQDTAAHLKRRKTWTRGFTPSALKGYEELVAFRAKQLVSRLEEQHGAEVFLNQWINFFAYDIMSDIAFGGGSELLMNGDEINHWSILEESNSFSTFVGHLPWLGMHLGRVPFVVARIKRFLAHCRGLAMVRIKRGATTHDLFHYLSHEDIGGASPPLPQLVDDGVLAIVAGSDTTSTALTNIFTCILNHPDAYEKLQAEIDRFYPPGEDAFDTKHHKEMHYLNAVINETLRFLPPVPACTQRQQPHNGPGVVVGSVHIPPGTSFWVHVYSMHRDPRNFFPAPEAFWPDRWLIAAGDHIELSSAPPPKTGGDANFSFSFSEKPFVHNEAAFMPFSFGPMNCVGKNLALQELRTVICAVLQRFTLRKREGWTLEEYEREYKDFFMTTRADVPARLEVRKTA